LSEQQTTVDDALESELGIDPQRFNTVFSQVWGKDEDPEDRVHIDTEVESEIIDLVEDWAPEIHNDADGPGEPDKGLFLVIEGAQATGKTTMTRYIRNQLDPTENPGRENIPMVIPVWDAIASNLTPYHYRDLLKNEGKRVFEEVEVPGIDDKVNLLNGMNAELSEDRISEIADEAGSSPDQIEYILGEAGLGEGEYDPEEVVKQLANEGYLFLFVLDEMVSESDANKAKSVFKWFKDHLYPYVGLVLFSHPDVSSAIKSEMQDQATRRNIDRTLEIAGDNYDIKEDIVINIRRKQHRIVDLEKLLKNYFSEVYIEEEHPEYGPLTGENIEWMNELLAAGGLIGNLVNGINTAIERYAEDRANGDQSRKIGTYLFDECSRHMSHVQIKQKLAGSSDLDPNQDSEVVRKAKELITRSISLEDLRDEIKDELEENRCLIEDSDTGDLQLNPYVANYEESDHSRPRETVSRPEEDEADQLAAYREAVTSFNDDKANDRGTLRRNVDVGLTTLLERVNSEQINIAKSSTLTLPGGETPESEFIEIVGSSTTGRAEKIEIGDGDLSDYNYRFLLTTLFSDESLNDPEIKNDIQEWFDGDNGILIITNKDEDEFTEPGWFNDPISKQQWRDNEYTWGDVTKVIHVNRLRDLLGLYRHLQEEDFEDDSEILAEIRRLSGQSQFPELPDFDDVVTTLYKNTSESIRDVHENIYEKYDGPTLPEAEAFSAILDEVKDRGFISDRVLDELREEHGVEIESLIKKGAVKEFTTEDGRTVVYLKEDFGSASKIGTIGNKQDLFPVGSEVFEILEEFHEMEADRITRSDDEISNRLEDLEQRVELIDFFLYGEDKLSDIKEQIQNSDASIFDDVLDEISEAKNTDKEDFDLVREKFESDQDLWTKIQGLEVDDDISPIHRELFYAKLPEQPPNWAEDYLDDDRQYPILIYNLYQTIQEVLEELNDLDESVSEDFQEQSGDLDDYRSKLEEFVSIDSDSNGENVELNDSSSEDLIELSNEGLKEFDYTGYIVDIAENESKRSNLSSATSLLTRVDGIRDDFVKVTQNDSLDEISHETASEYTDVGEKIAQKLLEDEVLFDDESDEPELIIQDFQKFCTQIENILQDSERLKTLEESEEDEKERVESIPGDDVDAKIEYLEDKIEDLENAERYLKLKEEHCEVCKSDWEDLSPERKEEISEELERMKEEYSDVDFSLDSIGQAKEETEERKETADDVEGELEEIRKKKSQIDLNEFTSELSALRKKYASD
jgi:hypothetical protein